MWMVMAGVGCSVVPASSLEQDLKNLDQIQQVRVAEFNYQLAVWIVWNENCRPMQGTEKALADMFAEAHRLRVVDSSHRRGRGANRPSLGARAPRRA
jgi:DNA-binding transcriptional LysR family regulator